ncbi:hypothetical protein [Mycobacterium sp. 1465703.0]|uniref:hypothetical protein n=1 Tax=Mycobacterium sp. 1465703.0 TaxID=1834078 RepID=UPI000800F697|nr:hypothetical protein [Mycobacterium sp. 1465703.0]OBI95559.1 hypothetical protein A5625_08055 [Mycobacterium sp. 1465703.0]
MRVRITGSARKHGINSGRIRAALANAVLHSVDGDYALYIGTDDRGVELEIGLVPDDRFDDQFAAIHCLPTEWRK